jgi:glycosyltransferase involved in cell wall biosynthesis
MLSLVIPVYLNEESIDDLLSALTGLHRDIDLEVVFVVDGSPDRSFALLSAKLPEQPFRAQLIRHSRNFGSFAAIRTGLVAASGDHFAVMAADLQEPVSLIKDFSARLRSGDVDVVIGQRTERADNSVSSRIFWWLYRRLIQRDIPEGGVDVFGCNQVFRRFLIALEEANSSLVGLLFWLGFRREAVPYQRLARAKGKSAWTLKKKLRYLNDSIYAFSDLPVRVLFAVGLTAIAGAALSALVALVGKLTGYIDVRGYTTLILTVVFFGGLNSLGLGILGGYLWRTFENTKRRPLSVVQSQQVFDRSKEAA